MLRGKNHNVPLTSGRSSPTTFSPRGGPRHVPHRGPRLTDEAFRKVPWGTALPLSVACDSSARGQLLRGQKCDRGPQRLESRSHRPLGGRRAPEPVSPHAPARPLAFISLLDQGHVGVRGARVPPGAPTSRPRPLGLRVLTCASVVMICKH